MKSHKLLGFRTPLLALMLIGCASKGDDSPSRLAEPKPMETIQRPDPNGLAEFHLTNWNFLIWGPPGLIVQLPKGCKVLEVDLTRGLERLPATHYIQTPSGGWLEWSYGQADPTDRGMRDFRKFKDALHSPELRKKLEEGVPQTTSRQVIFGDWIGESTDTPLAAASPCFDGKVTNVRRRDYGLWTSRSMLTLIASWPDSNEAAREEAIASAEAFIVSMKVDPKTESVRPEINEKS